MTNPNDPAFPEAKVVETNGTWINSISGGLTKREYFAAMAMQGIIGSSEFMRSIAEVAKKDPNSQTIILAQNALLYADAIIAELSK